MQRSALADLHGQGRMTWTEPQRGWVAVPDEVVAALTRAGFEECKREMTTSRRGSRPAGGLWQGINMRTGAVASAIWVNRRLSPQAIVFITVDGELLQGDLSDSEPNPYRDEGGEG